MKIFRRTRKPSAEFRGEMEGAGLAKPDQQTLESLIRAGADPGQPRQALYYLYADSAESARSMAHDAEAIGFRSKVEMPLSSRLTPQELRDARAMAAGESGGLEEWAVICEIHTVLSPATVRRLSDDLEELAARHGGTYDGWVANVEPSNR